MHRGTRWLCSICGMAWYLALVPSPAVAAGSRAEAGAAIYANRCAGCHGEDLKNTSGGWSFDLRRLRPDEHDRFVKFGHDRQGQRAVVVRHSQRR